MREKELRLALICYGGVSLAIYMHGITREIWHLVRASRAFHDDIDDKAGGSEDIYRELLRAIEASSNTKMRVFSDIIAGSSAGGINGVFLSQAIVTGQSLEPLTDLWLKTADVETLIDPDARPLSRFSKFWAIPIAWAILRRKGGAVERTVALEAREEVASKLSRFVRARWFKPPFGGLGFSQLLFNAFDAMEKAEKGAILLPKNQPLDLFVTVTDFAGHDETLRLNSPPQVQETEHRITISFSTRNNKGSFLAETPNLVFAARATASFPGAFPPFSAREIDKLITARKTTWPGRDAFLKRILPQQYAAGTAADTMLIDGSVLANAPFNQAIDALRNRPARREVDRRFVYIDPKPGKPSFRKARKPGEPPNIKPPGWLATIFGATSNIPREQPIRDSLDKLQGRSERIERMQAVISSLHIEIERTVDDMLGRTWFLSKPSPARIEKWRATANKKAAAAAGYSYPAYGHLKLVGVVDDMIASAKRACNESSNAHFRDLKEAIWRELRMRGLDSIAGAKGIGATEQSILFFREHDVRFRIRRLRFLARRLADDVEQNDALGVADRYNGIAAMHDCLYECLSLYIERETAAYMGEDLTAAVQNGIEAPGAFIDMLAAKRNLIMTDRLVDEKLFTALCNMESEPSRIMLLGYLGYPLYDIATLPLLQGEGLDEFDPVKVDRISPEDALTIRKGGAEATLKGIELNNFGAFFSRTYRENDYLWGRLHGADRLIDILLSSLPRNSGFAPEDILTFKKRAFHAILDREAPRLTKIAPLIQKLRTEIDQIRP
ncbi:patatin-like protein [Sphingorhabdus arenilitoris]|uniref:Patatin-like protein n=1 Tax=Sphingorhabdus arenilitoris TaxID=1490041 RepID=A0ABV8RG82_9SPHN